MLTTIYRTYIVYRHTLHTHTLYTRIHTCTHTHPHTHTCTHTRTHTRTHTHTHTCTRTHTHTRAHTHTHARTHTHTHTHARAHTRARAHTHARARTHTHTHTHTMAVSLIHNSSNAVEPEDFIPDAGSPPGLHLMLVVEQLLPGHTPAVVQLTVGEDPQEGVLASVHIPHHCHPRVGGREGGRESRKGEQYNKNRPLICVLCSNFVCSQRTHDQNPVYGSREQRTTHT